MLCRGSYNSHNLGTESTFSGTYRCAKLRFFIFVATFGNLDRSLTFRFVYNSIFNKACQELANDNTLVLYSRADVPPMSVYSKTFEVNFS